MRRSARTDAETGPKEPPKGSADICECGYLDGVTVTVTGTDTATGETKQKSFRTASRRLVCPHCGGRNSGWRQRYIAHVASVARSHGRRHGVHKGTVWDVCLTLDTEAADAADVDAEGSVAVWFDRLWRRLRKRLTRADSDVRYVGTASAQLKGGRYHFHVVLFTSLHGYQLRELLHSDAGINGYVQPPKPNESNEAFAARRAAYAWDNAERAFRASGGDGRSYRFTASRGVGYDSADAKEKRRDAVRGKGHNSEADTSALVEENGHGNKRDKEGADHKGANRTSSGAEEAPTGREEAPTDRKKPPDRTEEPNAPPVDYGKDGKPVVVSRYTDAVARVRSVLTSYVGRRVHVRDVGPCRVLLVGETALEDCALAVTVYPIGANRAVDVPWDRIRCRHAPTLRTVSPKPPTANSSETMNDTEGRTEEQSTEEDDVVKRFVKAARYSTVTIVQRDGTRVRTRKDHRTGDVVETVLPPKGT